MRVLYQGKLDFFCGIYAVLNALSVTCGQNLIQSRDRFAATLRSLAASPVLWDAVITNRTDFHWLVERMLDEAARDLNLTVTRPFALRAPSRTEKSEPGQEPAGSDLLRYLPCFHARKSECPGREAVWRELDLRLRPGGPQSPRAVVFRFHRFINMVESPVISHWSTGVSLVHETLVLHDASKEEGAHHSLVKGEVAVHRSDVGTARPILLEPESLFFIQPAAKG